MLAQALVEYGGLSELGSAFQRGVSNVEYWARTAGPETWLMLGGAVLIFLWLLKRRR